MDKNRVKKIIRRPAVEDKSGLCKSSIYDLAAKDLFPKPIKLSERSSGWIEEEVDDWIEERIAARDNVRGK